MRPQLVVHLFPGPDREMVNPYLSMLVAGLRREGVEVRGFERGFDAVEGSVVHVHWPEMPVNRPSWRWAATDSARFAAALLTARRRGVPVVWTVHNLRAHDARRAAAQRVLWSVFPRLVSGWISLSTSGVGAAEEAFPVLRRRPRTVVAHGDYTSVVTRPSRAEARGRLGLPEDARVVAMVGRIMPYKGVEDLVAATQGIADPGVRLLLGGACTDDALRRRLEETAAGDERVRADLRRLSQAEVDDLLAAADLVVLPFRAVFNSGSLLLCLTSGRPVLAPRTPVFEEVAADVGAAWLPLFDGALTSRVVSDALDDAATVSGGPDLSSHDWGRIAARHVEFYRSLLGS